MSSWVVPAENKSRHKAVYNVEEFRSINVLDASLIRGAKHSHVIAGLSKFNTEEPIILYDGTQEQCDELFHKLMSYIHSKVKVICLFDDIDNPPDYVDMEASCEAETSL